MLLAKLMIDQLDQLPRLGSSPRPVFNTNRGQNTYEYQDQETRVLNNKKIYNLDSYLGSSSLGRLDL
jgi:hypothetical protein